MVEQAYLKVPGSQRNKQTSPRRAQQRTEVHEQAMVIQNRSSTGRGEISKKNTRSGENNAKMLAKRKNRW